MEKGGGEGYGREGMEGRGCEGREGRGGEGRCVVSERVVLSLLNLTATYASAVGAGAGGVEFGWGGDSGSDGGSTTASVTQSGTTAHERGAGDCYT